MAKPLMQKKELIHFRAFNKFGGIASRGGITVCYLPKDEESCFGISVCSTEDNYDRKFGAKHAVKDAWVNMHNTSAIHVDLLTRTQLFGEAKLIANMKWHELCERHNRPYSPLQLKPR